LKGWVFLALFYLYETCASKNRAAIMSSVALCVGESLGEGSIAPYFTTIFFEQMSSPNQILDTFQKPSLSIYPQNQET